MRGSWHFTEAERLLTEAAALQLDVEDPCAGPALQRALVHATLAAAAASTVNAFLDDDEPEAWAQAFANGMVDEPACRICGCTQNRACVGGCSWVPDPVGPLCSACAVETAEQSAAIVDANLSQMGVTLGGEAVIFDGQQGDMQQAYERNRAEGRDPVESAARAIVGLT